MLFKRIFLFVSVVGLFYGCSTKKNTFASRAYHNVTARYNGYYYSNESIDDGVYKIEKGNKDNFDKILPIFIYASPEKVKTTFPEFDRAIKKSSLCIQKHAIKDGNGNELAAAGKWIDNNWINIGVSHFYKREYFSGIEALEYVVRTYNKSKDKYTAMLWLIRANNEIGSISSAEPIISLLKNERNLPKRIRNEFPVVVADYYMRRGQNTEAIAKLMEAVRNNNIFTGISGKKRARYCFIIAQMLEQQKDYRRAVTYYKKAIALKPNYEMLFYSKIRVARLMEVKGGNSGKTKKSLLKMSKEFKNSDYYDVIFYTLGELEEREKNIPQAMAYYRKSVQTSVSNNNQKALSYLKMGDISFEQANYEPAESYYDSALAVLPKDHPDFDKVEARKKTLETLVGHIRTISREDSLQRIAKMSEADRNAFIDKMIVRLRQEEERKQRELEAAKNKQDAQGSNMPLPGQQMPGMPGQGAVFYFYNPNTVALGIADFTRKWGNRKLEDDWRRSNKAVSIDNTETKPGADSLNPLKNPNMSAVKSRVFYMRDLPLHDTLITQSNNKMIKAYYMLGAIYKEELGNTKKSIASLDELDRRFPGNKYQLNSYYMLYRIYQYEKNEPKAEFYKNKILTLFPESEFALLLKDPGYAEQISTKKGEAESWYNATYSDYKSANYGAALVKSAEGIKKYGKNEYLPRFEYIRAMSLGKLYGVDTLEYCLKLVTAKYPDAEVSPVAGETLEAIKRKKNPPPVVSPSATLTSPSKAATDTFAVDLNGEHLVVVFVPDDNKKVEGLKTNIGSFNGVYYGAKKFEVSSNLFGSQQMIVIKPFASAGEAMNYIDNLQSDPDLLGEDGFKKEDLQLFAVLKSNLPLLYKRKNLTGYTLFYNDNYKKLNSKN